MTKHLFWHDRFMAIALEARSWVKGPDLGVGCVIVSPAGTRIAIGYSGYPRGIADTTERLLSQEFKDDCMVHAELNAIINAATVLEGWTLYSTKAPCSKCCSAIIQAGITKVVAPPPNGGRWDKNQKQGASFLLEAGVAVIRYEGKGL